MRLKLGGVEGSVMRDEKNERPNGVPLAGSACAEVSFDHDDAGVRLSTGWLYGNASEQRIVDKNGHSTIVSPKRSNPRSKQNTPH